MSNTSEVPVQESAIRIGIILCDLGEDDVTALKFLVLQLNRLQRTFEFEFLPVPTDDPYIQRFSNQALVDVHTLHSFDFLERYDRYLQSESQKFKLKDTSPDVFILVSTARQVGNFIATGIEIDGSFVLGILTYGGWKSALAPPSLLEFILIEILAQAAYLISPSLRNSIHLATKGCLYDFTAQLSEARLHVLTGYICQDCRAALQSDGLQNLADELDTILEKKWLGKSSEPDTPAGIMAKLHADLFITTGLKPTFWERTKETLEQEWLKQGLILLVTVVGTALLFLLGLKK